MLKGVDRKGIIKKRDTNQSANKSARRSTVFTFIGARGDRIKGAERIAISRVSLSLSILRVFYSMRELREKGGLFGSTHAERGLLTSLANKSAE